MGAQIDITPETRIGALLEAYPNLEETLIAQAPVFKNLKNPVLRKTVGKVATLEKAAGMAGISPRALVQTLRAAAGLPTETTVHGDEGAAGDDAKGAPEPLEIEPPWVEILEVRETVDADAILEAGEAPLPGVMRHAAALEPDAMLRVTSSFRPVPLVDALRNKGYKTFTRETRQDRFETFVSRE